MAAASMFAVSMEGDRLLSPTYLSMNPAGKSAPPGRMPCRLEHLSHKSLSPPVLLVPMLNENFLIQQRRGGSKAGIVSRIRPECFKIDTE